MTYVYQKKFNKNTVGRDFIVGDIHGMYDEFLAGLKDVDFNRETDRMFSVGDLIDRGPNNTECLDLLNEPWFHATVGNHEDMMVKAIETDIYYLWYMNGGNWSKELDATRIDYYVDLIKEKMTTTILIDTDMGLFGICHAEPDNGKFNQEPECLQSMIWGRSVIQHKSAIKMEDVDYTVHGHTPVDNLTTIGQHLFIDTGCVYGGDLLFVKVQDSGKEPTQ